MNKQNLLTNMNNIELVHYKDDLEELKKLKFVLDRELPNIACAKWAILNEYGYSGKYEIPLIKHEDFYYIIDPENQINTDMRLTTKDDGTIQLWYREEYEN